MLNDAIPTDDLGYERPSGNGGPGALQQTDDRRHDGRTVGSGYSMARMQRNLTLVKSDWTGGHFRKVHGGDPVTVYPPVTYDFPDVAWKEREMGLALLARQRFGIHGMKGEHFGGSTADLMCQRPGGRKVAGARRRQG